MKNTHKNIIRGAALCVLTILANKSVCGEEFPEARADQQFFITQGFKLSSMPLLHRLPGDKTEAATNALVEKLCGTACPPLARRTPGSFEEVSHGDWTLQILGDGTAARYRALEVSKRAHSLAKEESQRTASDALVREGRAFIESTLAAVIVLGPDEKLVPLGVDYRFEAGQNLKTLEVTRSVVANRIVFGRTIHDVPIVGGGSRVVLTFANDGSLESFQYDWPTYRAANMQTAANLENLLERVKRVISHRSGSPMSTFPFTGTKSRGTEGIELFKNTVLQKLNCGYYDPGYASRDASAPVQLGCVYHVVRGFPGDRMGFAGAIPGAVEIEPDLAWPEASILRLPTPNSAPLTPGQSRGQ
jgi:hypothetical protein